MGMRALPGYVNYAAKSDERRDEPGSCRFAVPIHFLDATGFLFLVLRRSSGGWRRSSEPQSGNKGSEATCECPAREEIGKHLCFSFSVQLLQQNSTAMQS
jgi:hypothetical protein